MLDLIKPNGLGRFTIQVHSKKIENQMWKYEKKLHEQHI